MSSALRELKVTETLNAHQALIRDLQFSPDGQLLATARYFSLVFRVPGACVDTATTFQLGPYCYHLQSRSEALYFWSCARPISNSNPCS